MDYPCILSFDDLPKIVKFELQKKNVLFKSQNLYNFLKKFHFPSIKFNSTTLGKVNFMQKFRNFL